MPTYIALKQNVIVQTDEQGSEFSDDVAKLDTVVVGSEKNQRPAQNGL